MKPSSRRQDAPTGRSTQLRQLIASTAARLMAEDGISDYPLAKRKAARQLGSPDTDAMPSNAEVEAELRTYQSLYQQQEQQERLRELRQKALQAMALLPDFHPYLSGSVLDGTAGRFAEVDILLYPDSAKEVEIFLLGRQIPFEPVQPRHERVETVLQLDLDGDTVNLVIYPPQDEWGAHRSRDGRLRERARPEALRSLLQTGPQP